MRQVEGKFKERFLTLLRQIPDAWFEAVQGAGAIRGIPDVVGCVAGICVALELKKDENEARKNTGRIVLQKYKLKKISKAGGYTALVTPENHQTVIEELTFIASKKSPYYYLPRCHECGRLVDPDQPITKDTRWTCGGCSSGL